MKKIQKNISIFLLLFTAINALVAGLLFMIDPSGNLIGMTPEYLTFSPFQSFLIPGTVLFLVIGVMNILVTLAIRKRYSKVARLVFIQGILLTGWIIIQVIMVKEINFLHVMMFAIGVTLTIIGFIEWNFHLRNKMMM